MTAPSTDRAISVAKMMIEEYGFQRAIDNAHCHAINLNTTDPKNRAMFGKEFWRCVIAALHEQKKQS